MRILQITSARHFGGGERHLVDLCRGLSERGHDVFVALRPTNEWQERLDFIPKENFLHVSIRNSFGMFSAKRIGRFLNDQKIDIVHAHVARDYLAASVADRMAKATKFVLTRHVLFPLKPFHRFALNNVDAAIGVSPAVGQHLASIFPTHKINIIPNGLDVKPLANLLEIGIEFRNEHAIPLDAPLIGTIGELKPLKGQRDFVLAAHEIVKVVPDCRFLIVGVDNSKGKKFRRELKRLVKVFRLAERFLWLDWVDDMQPIFAALDVFVSPSHSESFGLALLEAMASGKAVVATETDGAQSLIDDRSLLVPVNDGVALANKLVEILGDPERIGKIGAILKSDAAEKFSMSGFIDAHESLYQKLNLGKN